MGPPKLLRYYIGGLSKFITILHGGGGLPDLLQYYKGEGGVSRDPKFVLRNIWTAPRALEIQTVRWRVYLISWYNVQFFCPAFQEIQDFLILKVLQVLVDIIILIVHYWN